ncbi:MAG TPA: TAXI family TRAP transporter solute-binding subunit [Hyphomicrobiaceae bacterium]
MRWFVFVLAAGLATSLMPGATLAQEPKRTPLTRSPAQQALSDRLNQNTVTVISGNPNGTYLFFAYDMSAVLDDGDNLRVLPVVGKGAFQNVKDILHLKGVDLGITQSDIMSFLKKTPEFGSNIDDRMHYIAKLYNEEMHILAGPGINTIKDLDGKKVNYSDAGSGTQFSTRLIFEALGVKPQEVNMGQADGFLKVKSGEIAATVLIGGKPTAAFAKLQAEPNMKLLPVPYTEALETGYFPAKLSHEDYPGLIPEGQVVETIAVGAILACYAWPANTDRYRRVAKFTETFLNKFEEFRKPPRHVKWRETNISTPVKGWKRFQAAQEWIDGETARSRQTSSVRIDPDQARKQAARAAPGDANEQERLFQKFMEWSRQQTKQ